MKPPAKNIERLKNMGFRKCGEWRLEDGELKCIITDNGDAVNVLYVFVASEVVLYIGKSTQKLKKRLYGYQNPGLTQSTNTKGNRLLREMLTKNAVIEVHTLPDNGLLYYGGFHVNLAAGLEDNMIKMLKPEWNSSRKIS